MKDTNRNVGVYYQRNLCENFLHRRPSTQSLFYGNSSVEERRAASPEDGVSLTSSRAKKNLYKIFAFSKNFRIFAYIYYLTGKPTTQKTMRNVNNIFEFNFDAAEADSQGWSSIAQN